MNQFTMMSNPIIWWNVGTRGINPSIWWDVEIAEVKEIGWEEVAEKDEEAMWGWFSKKYDEEIIRQSPNHLLVRIRERFDLSEVVKACEGFRKYEEGKRGQPASYSTEQLCRGLLVKHLYGWSYRETAAAMQENRMVRWYVGLGIRERVWHYTTLNRFSHWVKENASRAFFTTILKQIDEDFPEQKKAMQAGDTFAMVADVARESITVMIRNASQKMLDYLAVDLPDTYQKVMEKLDKEMLFGPKKEKPVYALKTDERKAREVKTAEGAYRCLDWVNVTIGKLPESSDYSDFRLWKSYLEKILDDEMSLTRNEKDEVVEVKHRTKAKAGAYRLGSTKDTDATFRNHGQQIHLGYNINIAASKDFVREIFASTGATPDAKGIPLLISNQLEHLGVVPPKFVYDQAAGYAKYMSQVDNASNNQSQLIARLVKPYQRKGRFNPQDFTLSEESILTCPNEISTSKAYLSNKGDGWNYRFLYSQCEGCPLMAKCRGEDFTEGVHRTVFISNHLYNHRKALAYMKTDEFKQDMKFRSNIERVIAGLVLHNDARSVHGIGIEQANFQVQMAATAYNLKRWAVLIDQKGA